MAPQGSVAPHRAEVAAQVGRQLVEVLASAGSRPLEITLSPEELGRVRMGVITEDGKITVSILAERPETLDLMRRHIDQLGQSFRNLGYEQVSFSFGQGAQSGDQAGADPHGQTTSPPAGTVQPDAETSPAIINLDTATTSGVDIRL
ncbi:flagellar hook-length control protein FliK [Sulfitobacter sp.]|uniref:flagellar hook-length control protein FliK n=1 Tax=Sulfitobacter sp. TaxID=1903071 RepID=UPI003001682B